MMSKNTEIKTLNNEGYFLLKDFNLSEVMAEEMSCLAVSFERIKIPIGGSTVFEIPGDDPSSPDTVREISAVILYQHPLNAYYREEYTGGANPPDCGSYDGITGVGDPGGSCKDCPYNVFGSGRNGAKACKNRRRMYLLREGDIFPMILSLPTGSLKGFTRYLMCILPKYKNSNAVVTRFTLKKAASRKGVEYSQVQFSVDRVLTPKEYALISVMSDQVRELSLSVGYDAEEANAVNADLKTGEVMEPLK